MSSYEKEMLSGCEANLALDRRKRKALNRLLESRETPPKAKEALQELLWDCELAIKNHETFIKHSMRPRMRRKNEP